LDIPFRLQFVFDRCGLKRWITIAQLKSVLSKEKSGEAPPVPGPDNPLSRRTGARFNHGYAGDVLSIHYVLRGSNPFPVTLSPLAWEIFRWWMPAHEKLVGTEKLCPPLPGVILFAEFCAHNPDAGYKISSIHTHGSPP
jgi:hypothetical protein